MELASKKGTKQIRFGIPKSTLDILDFVDLKLGYRSKRLENSKK